MTCLMNKVNNTYLVHSRFWSQIKYEMLFASKGLVLNAYCKTLNINSLS